MQQPLRAYWCGEHAEVHLLADAEQPCCSGLAGPFSSPLRAAFYGRDHLQARENLSRRTWSTFLADIPRLDTLTP
jgi:hypothetical protein